MSSDVTQMSPIAQERYSERSVAYWIADLLDANGRQVRIW